MGRVVPQQMVCPAARLTQRVHVGAAEKIGLHIHLVNVELSRLNLLVHILVAGVEAARVAAHGNQASLFLQRHDLRAVAVHIAQRNFHLNMFARVQTSDGLRGVHLRGRAQNHRVHLFDGEAVVQVGGDMGDAVFVGHLLRLSEITANQRHHFNAVYQLDAVQVFDAEGAGTGQGYFDGHGNPFVVIGFSYLSLNRPQ